MPDVTVTIQPEYLPHVRSSLASQTAAQAEHYAEVLAGLLDAEAPGHDCPDLEEVEKARMALGYHEAALTNIGWPGEPSEEPRQLTAPQDVLKHLGFGLALDGADMVATATDPTLESKRWYHRESAAGLDILSQLGAL